MRRFRSFFQKCFSKNIFKKIFKNFFVSSREKWFSSHIEHERHTLGVSKVFSKLFMNTSWAYLENWAFWALDIAPTLDVPVLFFFFSSDQIAHPVCTTFCALCTFTKSTQYLILNPPKTSSLKYKTRRVPLSNFLALWDFPRPFFPALWDFFFEIF